MADAIGVLPQLIGSFPKVAGFTGVTKNLSTFQTLTKPAGVSPGDLLLILVANDEFGGDAQWDNSTLNPQTGIWTLINEAGTTQADTHCAAFWRIADGTEGATIVVNHLDNRQSAGHYLYITGARKFGNPIDVIGPDFTSGPTSTHIITEIVTKARGGLAFFIGAHDGGDGFPFTVQSPWILGDELFVGTTGGVASVWGTQLMRSAGVTREARVVATTSDSWSSFCFSILPEHAPELRLIPTGIEPAAADTPGVVPIQRRRTRQPPAGVQINWGNPLTRELAFACPLNTESESVQDLTGNEIVLSGDTRVWTAGQKGKGLVFTAGGTDQLGFSGSTRFSGQPELTTALIMRNLNTVRTTDRSRLFSKYRGGFGVWNWSLNRTTSNGRFNWICRNSAGTQGEVIAIAPYTDLLPHVFVGTYNLGALAVYVDGQQINTGDISGGLGLISRDYPFGLHTSNTGAAVDNEGLEYYGIFVWNRELSRAEAESFSANPYQVFTPQTRLIPTLAAAAQVHGVVPRQIPW